jgi:hypothetical protein
MKNDIYLMKDEGMSAVKILNGESNADKIRGSAGALLSPSRSPSSFPTFLFSDQKMKMEAPQPK